MGNAATPQRRELAMRLIATPATAAPAARRDPPARQVDVLAALLDVHPDDASRRFDDEVRSAVADGRLDPATARALRWWQRASVRNAAGFAAAVAPRVAAALAEATAQVQVEFAAAEAAWQLAQAEPVQAAAPAGPDEDPAREQHEPAPGATVLRLRPLTKAQRGRGPRGPVSATDATVETTIETDADPAARTPRHAAHDGGDAAEPPTDRDPGDVPREDPST